MAAFWAYIAAPTARDPLAQATPGYWDWPEWPLSLWPCGQTPVAV